MADELFDTDILIDHLHGVRAATEYIRAKLQSGAHVHISVVTLAELLAGMRPSDLEKTEQLLALFTKHPITEEIARLAGDYLGDFSKTHHIDLGDAFIAATAKTLDAPLITRNLKHYPMQDIGIQSPE